jgi:hypothetical protein
MRSFKIAGSWFVLGLVVVAACSASGGTDDLPGGGATTGTGATGTGATGTGSGSGNGGSGAGINIDGSSGTGGNIDPDAACQSFSQEAKEVFQPADIIWAVDTSGSMVDEAAAVQANINTFSQQIVASGIDVHVVMLAAYPFLILPGICVPAPLGSGQCPPTGPDTKLPNFWHHPTAMIDSVDGAWKLITLFPDYKFMLRPEALKYIVVVTDDDSRTTGGSGDPGPYDNQPDKFITDYSNLDPMLKNASGQPNWKLSGIYSFTQCSNAAAVGLVWKDIVTKTGGVHGDICTCTNPAACAQTFQNVFNELATKIIQGSQPLTCEWQIPPDPNGQQLDPNKVNVDFIDQTNGTKETIFHVNDAASCDPALGGWYYDDNLNPKVVKACPATCSKITAIQNGKINVVFGCATINIPK